MTSTPTTNLPETRREVRARRRPGLRILLLSALVLTLAGGLGYAARTRPEQVRDVWKALTGARTSRPTVRIDPPPPAASLLTAGRLLLEAQAIEALGLATAKAEPQTRPIRLELLGTTRYIEDTLSKIRPMFKGRVDKVRATVGQTVKKGDPLVELYSTELAAAKNAYEIERIQWLYDHNLLKAREELFKTKAVSEQLLRETQNSEMKNRREYEVARDKLLVYGLSEEEIAKIDAARSGAEKARLTLRSPADGMVIERDVVPGNLYDENDTLLVIAPLDHLWVWGNVFESDLDMVKLGQAWDIRFPFLTEVVQGKVEYISNRVDPGTHAVRIRTSIPNPERRLKSDMLVRGSLEIPPAEGRTVIPRTALVVSDGHFHVFVKLPGPTGRFERRVVAVVQEKEDHVVVESGLKPDEEVVAVGGLILAQLYEDLQVARSGAPPGSGGVD